MPLASMYILGPLLALGAILTLAGVLRWTYGRDLRGPASPTEPVDYGLLIPVATLDDPLSAYSVRRLLAEAGIRSTPVPTADGRVQVLVFEDELDMARRLVG